MESEGFYSKYAETWRKDSKMLAAAMKDRTYPADPITLRSLLLLPRFMGLPVLITVGDGQHRICASKEYASAKDICFPNHLWGPTSMDSDLMSMKYNVETPFNDMFVEVRPIAFNPYGGYVSLETIHSAGRLRAICRELNIDIRDIFKPPITYTLENLIAISKIRPLNQDEERMKYLFEHYDEFVEAVEEGTRRGAYVELKVYGRVFVPSEIAPLPPNNDYAAFKTAYAEYDAARAIGYATEDARAVKRVADSAYAEYYDRYAVVLAKRRAYYQQ